MYLEEKAQVIMAAGVLRKEGSVIMAAGVLRREGSVIMAAGVLTSFFVFFLLKTNLFN